MLALLLLAGHLASCNRPAVSEEEDSTEPRVVVKRRSDGTLSSVNQVNEFDQVHGSRVTYFRDGTTVFSKQSFKHGYKHGPSLRYYENGQVFEDGSFENGERHGPHRKYHKSGELLAEYSFDHGHALPGLKEYQKDGTLVSSYPEVEFREIDHLASRNRIDLEISCSRKAGKMKYFVLKQVNGETKRTYLITKDGSTLMQYYIQEGEILDQKVDIIAEIPTKMGNILVLERSYRLRASNVK